MRSSRLDSVIPVALNTCLNSRTPPASSANRDMQHSSNIGLSSLGGPGRRMTSQPAVSIQMPGAVPAGFSRMRPPTGTRACRALLAGISNPRLRKRALMRSRISSSSTICRFSTRAKTFFVTSSSVGPSPPVAITRAERLTASRATCSRRSSLSPTIVLSSTSTPIEFSRSVRNSEFVSSRLGVKSSDPMAMISACCSMSSFLRKGKLGLLRSPFEVHPAGCH